MLTFLGIELEHAVPVLPLLIFKPLRQKMRGLLCSLLSFVSKPSQLDKLQVGGLRYGPRTTDTKHRGCGSLMEGVTQGLVVETCQILELDVGGFAHQGSEAWTSKI